MKRPYTLLIPHPNSALPSIKFRVPEDDVTEPDQYLVKCFNRLCDWGVYTKDYSIRLQVRHVKHTLNKHKLGELIPYEVN